MATMRDGSRGYQKGFLLVIAVIVLSGNSKAQNLSADDFLPPVQAKTDEQRAEAMTVKQPDAVKTETDPATKEEAVVAASAQDAINTVVQKPEVGCKMVKFGSGFGWVATGIGTYRRMENPVATRIAQRNAYVSAFMMAKTKMAESLNGLSSDGKNMIRESLATIDTATESLISSESKSEESVSQAATMLLKGFVIYSVLDDTAKNTVYVSIVTTPKTRGKFNRPDSDTIEADSIRAGLDAALVEIRNGLVPPVGGRIISVGKTGEIGFVGFGSSVVRSDENAALQAKLNLQAERAADMRAKDALCGVILGDNTAWAGRLDEQTKEEIKDFEELSKNDPTATNDPAGVTVLNERRQTFLNEMRTSDRYESIRKGILPPGVTARSWKDSDNAIAYAVAVYLPSVSNEAGKTAGEMFEADILQPLGLTSEQPNGEHEKTSPKTSVFLGPLSSLGRA